MHWMTPSHFRRFEDLVACIGERSPLAVYKRFITRVHRLALLSHHEARPNASSLEAATGVYIRALCSAYLVRYKQANVFEAVGAIEAALIDNATQLVDCLLDIATLLSRSSGNIIMPPHMGASFLELLDRYQLSFETWRTADVERLVRRISIALVRLYRAEPDMITDTLPNDPIRAQFETQIQRLRGQLVQIAGEATLAELEAANPRTG